MGHMMLDEEVIRDLGFPAATVLYIIKQEFNHKSNNPRVKGDWVKMTHEEIHKMALGTVAPSTVRAAVSSLVKAGLLKKDRPESLKDHPMDRTLWYQPVERKKGKR